MKQISGSLWRCTLVGIGENTHWELYRVEFAPWLSDIQMSWFVTKALAEVALSASLKPYTLLVCCLRYFLIIFVLQHSICHFWFIFAFLVRKNLLKVNDSKAENENEVQTFQFIIWYVWLLILCMWINSSCEKHFCGSIHKFANFENVSRFPSERFGVHHTKLPHYMVLIWNQAVIFLKVY